MSVMPFISAVIVTLPSDTPTSAPSPSFEIYATEVSSTVQVILEEEAKENFMKKQFNINSIMMLYLLKHLILNQVMVMILDQMEF